MTFVVLDTSDPAEADAIVSSMNFGAAVEREIDRAAIDLATTQDRAARMRAFGRLKALYLLRPAGQVKRMEREKGIS